MARFEPLPSGVENDCSTNWATTTAQYQTSFYCNVFTNLPHKTYQVFVLGLKTVEGGVVVRGHREVREPAHCI